MSSCRLLIVYLGRKMFSNKSFQTITSKLRKPFKRRAGARSGASHATATANQKSRHPNGLAPSASRENLVSENMSGSNENIYALMAAKLKCDEWGWNSKPSSSPPAQVRSRKLRENNRVRRTGANAPQFVVNSWSMKERREAMEKMQKLGNLQSTLYSIEECEEEHADFEHSR